MKLNKTRVTVLLALYWLLTLPTLAVNPDELLPPEQAFAFSARINTAGKVDFRWKIADGYYLYKSRIHFKSLTPGITLGEAQLPKGKVKEDEFFGTVETYRHKVRGRLPYQGQAPALELEVESQGCADIGVCYPPYRQTVKLELPAASSSPSVKADPKPVPLNNLFATPEANDDGFLDPDIAFRADAIVDQPDRLLARFESEKGYYLYRDKFRFRVLEPAGMAVTASFPSGVFHDDPEFGRIEAYEDLVEIPLALKRGEHTGAMNITLEMDYQGCKKDAICYPPQKKQIQLQLPALPAAATRETADEPTPTTVPETKAETSRDTNAGSTGTPLSEQDRLAASLADQGWLAVLAFFGFGLLLAFTPCVFPMIPILSGIIAGQGDNMNARKGFVLSLVYVLAMAVTYTVAGILAGLFGQNLQAAFQNPWILGSFSLVFVALALSMFGFFELQLPSALQSRLTEISNKQQGGNLVGVAIMGFLSALIVGPCVAPPLAAALIYIGQTQDPILGGAALFALSMGMGVPLLLVGIGAGKYLPRAGTWMDGVKAVFGVMLLGLALWMLERILPGQLIVLGWGLLLLISSVYMGAFEPLAEATSGWRKLWKGLGLALALAGSAQLAGALAGADDWLEPLAPFRGSNVTVAGSNAPAKEAAFITIHTEAELDQLMQQARQQGKMLMLDFYADWCIECKRMEKNVFSRPHVQEKMTRMLLVKADVTANDEENQKLLQRFGLIGPPATLFFAPDGRELKNWRLVGYMEADRFAQHLESLPQ